MSARGRAAALPSPDWRPPPLRQGLIVQFNSDDGRQSRTFDFAALSGNSQVREDLACAFGDAVGPLGSYRRLGSANSLWVTVRKMNSWIAANRPTMTGLAQLSATDARMMLNAMRMPNGDLPVAHTRGLFSYCSTVSDDVKNELRRGSSARAEGKPVQPYTEQEWRWISIALRGIIRQARARITYHHSLVADYRAGLLGDDRNDQRRSLGEVLSHYLHTGEVPLTESGSQSVVARIAGMGLGRGQSVKALIHLTGAEAWAFGALLVGLTGLNSSTVFELPVPQLRATSPAEPGIVFADAVKYRRGPLATMNIPLAALPTQLHPPGSDERPQHVLNTSLTTPFGVLMLLLELTTSARTLTGSRLTFAFFNGKREAPGGLVDGGPKISTGQRLAWMRPFLTGDSRRDAVLTGLHMNRLRRTNLERTRRPVAHTPTTFNRYLRGMDVVRHESFDILRETLDDEVKGALARRAMVVNADETAETSGQDTVLGACIDFAHSPLDDGQPCRQTFLTCLDCANARALPRHLPFQLAVLEALTEQRDLDPHQWATHLAGRATQLDQIVHEFAPEQQKQARSRITDRHRHLATRLLSGDLDPL